MTQLIARGPELARVSEMLNGLPARGGALVLAGDAGIGKTALAEAVVERAAARGARVISVTATESETPLAYAALEQILHRYVGRLESLRARPREVLERAFGRAGGETPDTFAVGVAVLEALADLATDAGLVLLIDDAHWVDESTAQVLAFVARRLSHDPVIALLVVRSGHPSPLLNAGLPTIELGPLSEDSAVELLRARRPGLSAGDQQRIRGYAAGNPLGLVELPADFRADERAPLSTNLQSAFEERVRSVAAPTATLLLAAALGDNETISELNSVATTLGISDPEFATALREFGSSGSVEVTSGHLRFHHPLVRSAVISAAPPEDRRRIHLALAEVHRGEPDVAVWHRALGVTGPDEEVASALEAAAERAGDQGNVAVSFRAWSSAVTLSENPSAATRRRLRAAEAAVELGRADEADAAIAAITETPSDPTEAARYTILRLALDPRAASPRVIASAIRQAHSALEAGDIDVAIELTMTIGEHADSGGVLAPPKLKELGQQLVAALPKDDPRALAVLAASDPLAHTATIAQALLALDPSQLDARAELLVRVRFNVDADPVLAAMQRRLLQSYRQRGRLRSIAFLQPIHAWNEICLGDWPEAIQAAEEGTRLAVELGLPRWGTGTTIAEGHIAALRGDHRRAEELILESERGAVAVGAHNVLTGIQLTKGTNHLAQGRYEEAFAAFRRPFDQQDPSYHPIQNGWILGDIAEAAGHLGRVDEIRPLFTPDNDVPTTPWRTMAVQYAQPFLAPPAEVDDAFRESLDGAVSHWPTYRARLLIEHGSWLRRNRQSQNARDQLRAGRDLADALGMGPWSERARTELRALGADSQPRATLAWEALSPQELEVAQLAAQGLSNREIGERLFLSHRTVGSHLYRIFPKLGVTNRAQLAAALRTSQTVR